MLLKELPNNLPSSLEGPLNCICTHASIKVNVFIQNNVYHIHNYVHKSMVNCLFPHKYSPSSYVLLDWDIAQLFLSRLGNFKTGVAYKGLAYKKSVQILT